MESREERIEKEEIELTLRGKKCIQRRILSPNGWKRWCLTTAKVCTVHGITYPRFVWSLILLPSNNVSNNCGERGERQSEILVSSNRIKSVSLTEFSWLWEPSRMMFRVELFAVVAATHCNIRGLGLVPLRDNFEIESTLPNPGSRRLRIHQTF